MPNNLDARRVLVCGGRDFDDLGAVWSQLDALHALSGPIEALIHGGARGADTLAAGWAAANRVATLPFPAGWDRLGPAAGPLRNQRMLEQGQPTLVLAFPGGRGTDDMVRRARKAGVEVVSWTPEMA